jgi:hypothetical protein
MASARLVTATSRDTDFVRARIVMKEVSLGELSRHIMIDSGRERKRE